MISSPIFDNLANRPRPCKSPEGLSTLLLIQDGITRYQVRCSNRYFLFILILSLTSRATAATNGMYAGGRPGVLFKPVMAGACNGYPRRRCGL
jgi:hypothetical protein